MKRSFRCWSMLGAVLLLACTYGCGKRGIESDVIPREFSSPDAAARALYDAAKAGDGAAILAIFGPSAKEFLISGDRAEDSRALQSFTADYDQMHRWGKLQRGRLVLTVGLENYPFPFPLVRGAGGKWTFDADGGRQEFLARRIGDNELNTMGVLSAMAAAQLEYFATLRDESQVHQYAQRLVSTEGRQDGLYWPTRAGEPESPLGPVIARAAKQGAALADGPAAPFHGYYFRVLTSQGANAAGGARSYIVAGRMTAGFALLAYPAEYRKTGVMTLLIDQDGRLYQKDLGPGTTQIADAVNSFDPDSSWSPVE